jgi:two-component system response regulator MprA
LVVDDDEAVRSAVADVLRNDGFDVALANDGDKALEAMQSGAPPALVLLDLMMPHVPGWQVLDTMKAIGRLAEVPVLVLTAFNAGLDLPLGCHVLHKPFEPELLVAHARALTTQAAVGGCVSGVTKSGP